MVNDKIEPGIVPEHDNGDVPDAKPEESPDFLATPKRGKGVRRLNRVPLIVIGAVLLAAVVGVTYTFFERQAQNAAKVASGPQPPVTTTAVPPVRPSGNDYISGPPQPPTDVPATPTDAQPQGQAAAAGSPVAPSEAYQNRMRIIQRLEEKKLADLEAALGSEGSVQNFNRKGGQQQVSQQQGASQASGMPASAGEQMQEYLAAVGGQPGAGGMPGGMGGFGGSDGNSMAAENRQDAKRAFLSGTPEANTYLAEQRKAAISPSQEIKAGTIIPGVMISGLNSDLPGQIIAQVRESVYDSATGTQLLVPAGARLVGTYDSGVTLGQQRALVGWNRIIYPDGSSISLDKMPGADVGGYAGFYDKVNNHYWRIFGSGLVLSVFSAGIQLSQPQASNGENYSSSQIIAGSLGQQMGQIGMQMAQRNMNIQPTLEIQPGYEFNVMVTKDILLPSCDGYSSAP